MGKRVVTDEMLKQIVEDRKTNPLNKVCEKWGFSKSYLSVKINRYMDEHGIEAEVRNNERSIPAILFHEFSEVCEELKRKASPELLKKIRLVGR